MHLSVCHTVTVSVQAVWPIEFQGKIFLHISVQCAIATQLILCFLKFLHNQVPHPSPFVRRLQRVIHWRWKLRSLFVKDDYMNFIFFFLFKLTLNLILRFFHFSLSSKCFYKLVNLPIQISQLLTKYCSLFSFCHDRIYKFLCIGPNESSVY